MLSIGTGEVALGSIPSPLQTFTSLTGSEQRPMAMTRAELLRSALELPEQDRLILADELLETIPDELFGCSDEDAHSMRVFNGNPPQVSWESFLSQLHLEAIQPPVPETTDRVQY